MVEISIDDLIDMDGMCLTERDVKKLLYHIMYKQGYHHTTMVRILMDCCIEQPNGHWKEKGKHKLAKFLSDRMYSYADDCQDQSYP
jgi:hypothetical protein